MRHYDIEHAVVIACVEQVGEPQVGAIRPFGKRKAVFFHLNLCVNPSLCLFALIRAQQLAEIEVALLWAAPQSNACT